MSAFDRIKDVFGSQSELARLLDVHPMVVSQWKRRRRIPAEWCIEIADASNGEISPSELRPDLYKPANS
ncbi:MAG: YdaS family helix-turn-helix protein [Cyanobacteria bacterium P01_F01_bin.3]